MKQPVESDVYSGNFYTRRRDLTLYSSRRILDFLFSYYPAKSVVDFGCGTGTWLSVAKELGAQRLVGIEGKWVSQTMMDTDGIELVTQDLEDRVGIDDQFELAISLEVGEHLSAERAPSFVEELCIAAPCVLFSAAVPHQGGRQHINEQWQSYWTKQFAANGYKPLDLIRPRIWNEEKIPFYYRQNILFYANPHHYQAIKKRMENDGPTVMLDIVHPIQLQKVADEKPGTKESLEIMLKFPSVLWASVSRRLGSS